MYCGVFGRLNLLMVGVGTHHQLIAIVVRVEDAVVFPNILSIVVSAGFYVLP